MLLFITILLLFFNAFFVASEFSLVKVRPSQLEVLVQKGSRRALLTQAILEKLDGYLSACQLGITLTSLGLGWIGEEVFSGFFIRLFENAGWGHNPILAHTVSISVAFSFLTFLHITLGEQIPKMVGINYALTMALLVSLPLKIFYVVFTPFIWILNKSTRLFMNVFGIPQVSEDVHTEEEIKVILTESEEGGAIKPSEHELIQNVFDFDDRIVRQVMIPKNKISGLDVELGREQIVRLIIEEGFSRFPVYLGDLDNIIGIVHARDILKSVVENNYKSIRTLMRPVHFVPETMKINQLLKDFQKFHIQIAIVIDEYGSTTGLVTMEDIIEELVGDIHDEHDEEKPSIQKINDREFIVYASTTIVDANNVLPLALPENPIYETVSGYVNFIFGKIPAQNEKITKDGYEITILKRNQKNVEQVKFVLKG
ncbi:MAG: hemolysin family protein [Bacteroidia bacterium]|nr:hemolysin family protein [Bacteroidia bacterium]